MIKVILVEMECENEKEINGLISAINSEIDYHCSSITHEMTVDTIKGVRNINKALRKLGKEESANENQGQ